MINPWVRKLKLGYKADYCEDCGHISACQVWKTRTYVVLIIFPIPKAMSTKVVSVCGVCGKAKQIGDSGFEFVPTYSSHDQLISSTKPELAEIPVAKLSEESREDRRKLAVLSFMHHHSQEAGKNGFDPFFQPMVSMFCLFYGVFILPILIFGLMALATQWHMLVMGGITASLAIVMFLVYSLYQNRMTRKLMLERTPRFLRATGMSLEQLIARPELDVEEYAWVGKVIRRLPAHMPANDNGPLEAYMPAEMPAEINQAVVAES